MAGLDKGTIDENAVRSRISRHDVGDAPEILDCLVMVAVILDYVKAVLNPPGAAGPPSGGLPMTPPLPVEQGAWKLRVAEIANARRVGVEEIPVLAGTESATRWSLRDALGLAESACATIGHNAEVTRETVTARARFLTLEERRRALTAIASLEAALGYASLHLGS